MPETQLDENYPETITADMLPRWGYITDDKILRDLNDTRKEIEFHREKQEYHKLQINRRQKFVDFLCRLMEARRMNELDQDIDKK